MVEHGRQKIYEKERVQWNTAWMKSHGHHFEIVINPDEALEFKRTGGVSPDIRECVRSEHIFSDAKKGQLAAEDALDAVFGTDAPLEISKRLVLEGEIQLSQEHRAQLREQKRNRILNAIHTFAIDPKTGSPHTRKRIELAMEEAKIQIDYNRDAESQIPNIVRDLQPIIPIKLQMVTLQVHLPGTYGQKLYGDLERFGTIKKADWMGDGSLMAYLEIPAGMQNDLLDDLNAKTHGAAEIKKVDESGVYKKDNRR